MTDVIDGEFLDVWKPGTKQARNLNPELPRAQSRQLDAEKGVRILDRLRYRPRETSFEHGSAICPVESADGAQADGPRFLVLAVSVRFECRAGLPEERLAAGHREQ